MIFADSELRTSLSSWKHSRFREMFWLEFFKI